MAGAVGVFAFFFVWFVVSIYIFEGLKNVGIDFTKWNKSVIFASCS